MRKRLLVGGGGGMEEGVKMKIGKGETREGNKGERR